MNQAESLKIVRLAKAASPAQAVDEYTPDLWHEVLKPFRFVDAHQALIELAGDTEWIHVSHVKARIKRIRGARLDAFGQLPEPPPGAEDPAVYPRWVAETRRRIGDGTLTERPALPAGTEKPRELDFTSVFRSVDDVDGAA
ncbi:MAG: hypothetical protein JWP74_1736 [Marmoricola sp.]|nr:hypothetical protein [Marmoricola sp.]